VQADPSRQSAFYHPQHRPKRSRCREAEESQAEIIKKYRVDIIALNGTYIANPKNRGAILLDGDRPCSVEEYACRYFRNLGYNALFVESVPFHVLFGVYMWSVIQDPGDSHTRIVSFGDRKAFDAKTPGELISTHLPDDFGTPGYGRRRAKAIKKHLSKVMCERGDLQRLFDYWLGPSESLRQYLWAHREKDIQKAQQLIDILPPAAVIEILRYLVENYWGHHSGWPDLLVHRGDEFFVAEVKSSRDKLGEKQKHWIRDNHKRLHFPFKLVKVHKGATATV
jgi:VRR-NUC domain